MPSRTDSFYEFHHTLEHERDHVPPFMGFHFPNRATCVPFSIDSGIRANVTFLRCCSIILYCKSALAIWNLKQETSSLSPSKPNSERGPMRGSTTRSSELVQLPLNVKDRQARGQARGRTGGCQTERLDRYRDPIDRSILTLSENRRRREVNVDGGQY